MAILGQIGLKAMAVTIELKMNFLRPAIGGDVLAQAQVLKLGSASRTERYASSWQTLTTSWSRTPRAATPCPCNAE